MWLKWKSTFLPDTGGALKVWGKRGRSACRLVGELVAWVPVSILDPLLSRPVPPPEFLPCPAVAKSTSNSSAERRQTAAGKQPTESHTVCGFLICCWHLTKFSLRQNTRSSTSGGPVPVWHWAAAARLRPCPRGGQDGDRKGAGATTREDGTGEEEASAAGSGSQG